MRPQLELSESEPFARLLDGVRISGDVHCTTEAGGDWGVYFPPGPCHFHYVEYGDIVVELDRQYFDAKAGDLLMFVHGAGHALTTRPGLPAPPLRELLAKRGASPERVLRLGSGQDVRLICGTFHFDQFGASHLSRGLPELLHVRGNHDPSFDWINLTLRFLGAEASHPAIGSANLISNLINLMFIQAVRHWAAREGSGSGLAAACADRAVAKALTLIHETPAFPWTGAILAQRCGASRAALFVRFSKLLGCPPLRYLTDWRMALARQQLAESDHCLAHIAELVGYSEAAFSRAFAREVGMTPSAYRRQLRLPATPPADGCTGAAAS